MEMLSLGDIRFRCLGGKSHNSKGSDYWLVRLIKTEPRSGCSLWRIRYRRVTFAASTSRYWFTLAGVSYSSANGDTTEEAKGDAFGSFVSTRIEQMRDKRYGGSGQDWFDDLEAAPDGGFPCRINHPVRQW